MAEGEVLATEEAGTGEVREAGAMVLAMVGPRGAAVRAVVWVDGGWGGDGGGEAVGRSLEGRCNVGEEGTGERMR